VANGKDLVCRRRLGIHLLMLCLLPILFYRALRCRRSCGFSMKIYQRYIAREVSAAAILLVLLAFLALFAFFDLLGEVKNFGQGGYQLQHAFGYVMLRLPGRSL
jgi:hypothetical protein